MHATFGLRLAPVSASDDHPRPPVVGREAPLPFRLAIAQARQHLVDAQLPGGGWPAGGVSCAASAARALLLIEYRAKRTGVAAPESDGGEAERLTACLEREQLDAGGWAAGGAGHADLATSVLSYFALKLRGGADALPRLRESLHKIHALGGAQAAGAEALAWLALFGQLPTEQAVGLGEPLLDAALRAAPRRAVSPMHGARETFLPGRRSPLLTTDTTNNPPLPPEAKALWRRLAGQEQETDDNQLAPAPAKASEGALSETATAVQSLTASGLGRSAAPTRRALQWLVAEVEQRGESLGNGEAAAVLAAFAVNDRQSGGDLPPPLIVARDGGPAGPGDSASGSFLDDAVAKESLDKRAYALRMLLADRLASTQLPDGSWHAERPDPRDAGDGGQDRPSPGCSSVFLTAQAVVALGHHGVRHHPVTAKRAAEWLRQQQGFDGGWSADGVASATEVTARAVTAIAAAAGAEDESAVAGVNWLLASRGMEVEEGAADRRGAAILAALVATGFSNESAAIALVDQMTEELSSAAVVAAASVAKLTALAGWASDASPRRTPAPSVRLKLFAADPLAGTVAG